MSSKYTSINEVTTELNNFLRDIDKRNKLLENELSSKNLKLDNLIEKNKYSNSELDRLKRVNKELNTRNEETKRNYDNLLIKNGNLQKRIEKYEEIYSNIPGTTREDKYRLLLFITEEILPWIIESANSRTYKKIVEFWNYFLKKEKSNKKKYTGGYYVYSHTIIGEKFPFYIGFSRNNDGQYNRSKEFTQRHETWNEYVSARGDKTNIDVNIIGEVKTEEAAIELEKFYIRHYAEDVVNILKY